MKKLKGCKDIRKFFHKRQKMTRIYNKKLKEKKKEFQKKNFANLGKIREIRENLYP